MAPATMDGCYAEAPIYAGGAIELKWGGTLPHLTEGIVTDLLVLFPWLLSGIPLPGCGSPVTDVAAQ